MITGMAGVCLIIAGVSIGWITLGIAVFRMICRAVPTPK